MNNFNTPTDFSQSQIHQNQSSGKISSRSQFYRFSLACGTTIVLDAVEAAGLSYIPCTHEKPLFKFAHLWNSPTQINLDTFPYAHGWNMKGFQGVQIFTGKPTKRYRDGITEYLTVLDVEVRLLERYPDLYQQIEQAYHHNIDGTPFVIQTKSGGRQFYGYVPDYHERKREFKDVGDNEMLLEFLSDKCLARIDDRYRIETGSLLNIPTLSKETLKSIYHLVQPHATEHQVCDHPTQTVERSQLGDLEIDWNEKGVSQYFPAAQCQATDHKDLLRETVQFRKWDGGIKGHCYNCGESWWEVEPPSIAEPPDAEPISLSIFSKIPELRVLVQELGSGLSDWTWQYPGTQNGQPHEQLRRHLYNLSLKSECPYCHKQVPSYLDIGRLTAGPHCPECNGHLHKPEVVIHSYLLHELQRKPQNTITSNHQGYISDDPLLADESLWHKGGVFHLGAPMGSGKTTLILQRAREAAEAGAITIIAVPRRSLAIAVRNELNVDTTLGWALYIEGSGKQDFGKYGAVCTLGRLPDVLQKAHKSGKEYVRIFIDELDFAVTLRLADIFKELSTELKVYLRESVSKTGLVTAGATATTLGLEALSKELGCDLQGYYLSAREIKRTAEFITIDATVEQPKNRLVQAVIDHAKEILEGGKKVYIFGDERRSAQIIAEAFGDDALLYDAYHKDSPQNNDLLRLKRLPEGKTVFVSTGAVDVGVSLQDKNAETVVFSIQNPLNTNGLSSTVQQCLRNRALPALTVFFMDYQNALPLTPAQATDFQLKHQQQKLTPDESLPQGLVEQMGTHDAIVSLADNQPFSFFSHYLSPAGYHLKAREMAWENVDFRYVKALRKEIKDIEKDEVMKMALDLLCPEKLLTDKEIRKRDWSQSQPAPINQLAHERAYAILCTTGWDGKVERAVHTVDRDFIPISAQQAFEDAGVTEQMWEAARYAVEVELCPKKVERWEKGFLTKHYQDKAIDEFDKDVDAEYEPHHRSDALFIGSLIKELLEVLPPSPATEEEIGEALIKVAQAHFGKDRFSALMKDGSVSPKIAKQVRFIGMGRDAKPTQAHCNFVLKILPQYYPASFVKCGENHFQLTRPQDEEQVLAFLKLMACRVTQTLTPDDLTPPPYSDPKASDKALVFQLKSKGASFREIEQETGISRTTACRWSQNECHMLPESVPFHSNIIPRMKRNGTLALTESSSNRPETRTTTASDIDSTNVTSNVTSDIRQTNQTFRNQILKLLDNGQMSTKEITEAINGKRTAIMNELKRLADAGEIVRVRHGVYDLAIRCIANEISHEEGNQAEPDHLHPLNQLQVFEGNSIIDAIGERLAPIADFRKRFYTPPRPVPKWATDLYHALRAKYEP